MYRYVHIGSHLSRSLTQSTVRVWLLNRRILLYLHGVSWKPWQTLENHSSNQNRRTSPRSKNWIWSVGVDSVTSTFFAKRIVIKSNSTVSGQNISCDFGIAHSKSNFLLHTLNERFLDLPLMWTLFLVWLKWRFPEVFQGSQETPCRRIADYTETWKCF